MFGRNLKVINNIKYLKTTKVIHFFLMGEEGEKKEDVQQRKYQTTNLLNLI